MHRFCVAILLVLTACAPASNSARLDEVLPDAAISAFQAYVHEISAGRLTCPAMAIEAAPRHSTDFDQDGIVDHAIEAGRLQCEAPAGQADEQYFCGRRTCVFPLLISQDGAWRVIPLMSGNAITVERFARETRFVVSQGDFSTPGGALILVREYAWRSGQFLRVAERQETPI